MAIAGKAASFGYPEIKLGVVPAGIMPPLAHRVGARATFELIATGRTVDAEEALRLGLVNRAVAADAVLDEALAVAGLLAGYAPDAISAIKELVRRIADLSLADGLDYVRTRPSRDG
jgi:enoyl-CoA hydratase/carnithine racemase